jgi:hypothetical protein
VALSKAEHPDGQLLSPTTALLALNMGTLRFSMLSTSASKNNVLFSDRSPRRRGKIGPQIAGLTSGSTSAVPTNDFK